MVTLITRRLHGDSIELCEADYTVADSFEVLQHAHCPLYGFDNRIGADRLVCDDQHIHPCEFLTAVVARTARTARIIRA
jgi:hypothetical protein